MFIYPSLSLQKKRHQVLHPVCLHLGSTRRFFFEKKFAPFEAKRPKNKSLNDKLPEIVVTVEASETWNF